MYNICLNKEDYNKDGYISDDSAYFSDEENNTEKDNNYINLNKEIKCSYCEHCLYPVHMLSEISFDGNKYIVCDTNKVSLYNKLINDKKINGSNNSNLDKNSNNNKCYCCNENIKDKNINKDFDNTIDYINDIINIEYNLIKEYQYNLSFNFVKDILYIEQSLIDYTYYVKDLINIENNFIKEDNDHKYIYCIICQNEEYSNILFSMNIQCCDICFWKGIKKDENIQEYGNRMKSKLMKN